jgi:hypothetical protein
VERYNDKGEVLYNPPGPTLHQGRRHDTVRLHERHLATNRSEEVQYATRGFAPGCAGIFTYGTASHSAMYTSSMADPITFRPTVEDAENLAVLTADGTSPTHAIRRALEIAAHNKRQEDLRADAARLAANPEYQAEIRAVREELDELRAW